jgi:hypothetical protein
MQAAAVGAADDGGGARQSRQASDVFDQRDLRTKLAGVERCVQSGRPTTEDEQSHADRSRAVVVPR